jgi:hypothetical protein
MKSAYLPNWVSVVTAFRRLVHGSILFLWEIIHHNGSIIQTHCQQRRFLHTKQTKDIQHSGVFERQVSSVPLDGNQRIGYRFLFYKYIQGTLGSWERNKSKHQDPVDWIQTTRTQRRTSPFVERSKRQQSLGDAYLFQTQTSTTATKRLILKMKFCERWNYNLGTLEIMESILISDQ